MFSRWFPCHAPPEAKLRARYRVRARVLGEGTWEEQQEWHSTWYASDGGWADADWTRRTRRRQAEVIEDAVSATGPRPPPGLRRQEMARSCSMGLPPTCVS